MPRYRVRPDGELSTGSDLCQCGHVRSGHWYGPQDSHMAQVSAAQDRQPLRAVPVRLVHAHAGKGNDIMWRWVKENILHLHMWVDAGGFLAENTTWFTRQRCLKCPKTRVSQFRER